MAPALPHFCLSAPSSGAAPAFPLCPQGSLDMAPALPHFCLSAPPGGAAPAFPLCPRGSLDMAPALPHLCLSRPRRARLPHFHCALEVPSTWPRTPPLLPLRALDGRGSCVSTVPSRSPRHGPRTPPLLPLRALGGRGSCVSSVNPRGLTWPDSPMLAPAGPK